MKKKMNPVVHFEMPYEDKQRMADFYIKVFGWEMQMLGSDMGNYVVARTTETDEKNTAKKPGTINGGFYAKTASPTSHAPSFVIAVDDIEKSMEAVKAAGGKINNKPENIPGVGKHVSFNDTEGNRVSMLQTLEEMYQ